MTSKKLIKHKKRLCTLNWNGFEKLVTKILSKYGWKVYHTQKSKDGGIDIIATKKLRIIGFFKIVCQVKKYSDSNPVRINVIRELGYLISETKASKGLIVTTSRLTRDAIRLVKQNQYIMSYIDAEALIYLLFDERTNRSNLSDDLPF